MYSVSSPTLTLYHSKQDQNKQLQDLNMKQAKKPFKKKKKSNSGQQCQREQEQTHLSRATFTDMIPALKDSYDFTQSRCGPFDAVVPKVGTGTPRSREMPSKKQLHFF